MKIYTSVLYKDQLYVGGSFTTVGNVVSTGQRPIAAAVAHLDTHTMSWKAVATNGNGPVYDLGIAPADGRLWAVGGMTLLAPTLTGTGGAAYFDERIHSWIFPGLPTQFILASEAQPLKAITFDANSNPIIGGHPGVSAGVNVLSGLARLNPSTTSWEVLGGGICDGIVEDLAVWNNKLFVGGNFTRVACANSPGIDAPGFAVLDLSSNTWSTLDANLTSGDAVYAFELTNFAARNSSSTLSDYLIVAGKFSQLNDDPSLANLAIWDGDSWSAVSTSVAPVGTGAIHAVHTDGVYTYIGGAFEFDNFTNLARWDGSQWNSLNNGVFCLAPTCQQATVRTISSLYVLDSEIVTPLNWGGFNLDNYINWRWWLICLCAVIIAALVLAILTNCCWKTIGCCRKHCMNSKPRKKDLPGL